MPNLFFFLKLPELDDKAELEEGTFLMLSKYLEIFSSLAGILGM